MENFMQSCASGTVSNGFIFVVFWLWLKYGKPKETCADPVKCTLKDEDWKRNHEEHTDLFKRVRSLETDSAAQGVKVESIECNIADIKATMTRVDNKLDTLLMK